MKNNTLLKTILLIAAASFLIGVVNLFHIRFHGGDIYPVYSSLRSDPLGTKIMFKGLNNIRGVSAVRNYQPLHKIGHLPLTTYLLLGMQTKEFSTFSARNAENLESIASDGGRIAMTFLPEKKPSSKCGRTIKNACDTNREREQEADDDQVLEKHDADHDPEASLPFVDLAERWGAVLKYHDSAESNKNGHRESVLITDRYSLPERLSWHSRSFFKIEDDAWTALYAVDGRPVLIERTFGNGKIILATDTYFFSNEAMLKERRPDILSWLIGQNRRVLFDETHLGIIEKPNLASLIRKYRLHGLIAVLLFLAALFIWKNSSSFIPPGSDVEENARQHSKDYLSGLVNLLSRNIKIGDIIDVCFQEWMKTPGRRSHNPDEVEQVKRIIEQEKRSPAGQGDPLKSYELISQILDKRRTI